MSTSGSIVTEEGLEQLTSLFRLLSDKTRLNILLLLADGERNVTNLCDTLQLPQPTVSHHLGLLRMSRIITNRRAGKQVFYALNGNVQSARRDAFQIASPNFNVKIESRAGDEARSEEPQAAEEAGNDAASAQPA